MNKVIPSVSIWPSAPLPAPSDYSPIMIKAVGVLFTYMNPVLPILPRLPL